MNTFPSPLYQRLPSIDRLFRSKALHALHEKYGHHCVREAARTALSVARAHIETRHALPIWAENEDVLGDYICQQVKSRQRMTLRPVFNLSGTVLHTNLGRALLAEEAISAVAAVMRQAAMLEYDPDGAGRSHRDRAVSALLVELTGAEAACIVNNNAAAVFLLLASLASGREVLLARGELVEIGGAFRMPDIMREAGCKLVEVGTTNRTHLHDYTNALSEESALLMKVHASNYAISGFTHAVSEAELAALAHERGIMCATDLGSGALIDLTQYGLPKEPMVAEFINAGVDLVSFSGDKLLGGPQAGIIVGKRALIARLQSHPLKRALRCDKMTLAALEATLQLYRQPEKLADRLPSLRLLTRSVGEIQALCQRLLPTLQQMLPTWSVQCEACLSQIGSGSLPVERLPSYALSFSLPPPCGSEIERLAARFRALPLPVIGRIKEQRLWLDMRCLEDEALFLSNLAMLTN